MEPQHRLVRSTDRWIAGVCGGIAEYFSWPTGRVRAGYLLLSFLSAAFPGLLLYLVLWLIMPPPSLGHQEFRLDDYRVQ